MKLQSIALASLFMLAFISCNKKPQTPYDEVKNKNMGYVIATVNGKEWKSNFAEKSYYNGTAGLTGSLYIDGLMRQSISLSNVKLRESTIQKLYSSIDSFGILVNSDSSQLHFFLTDHDVLEATYYVFEGNGAENYIIIDKYDSTAKQIAGRFQATLYTTDDPAQGFDDTLRITDGFFNLYKEIK